jgi:hypothetical protein
VKEIQENNRRWYGFLRWLKFVLLWFAIIFVVVGTTYFVRSILVAEPADNAHSTTLRFGLKMAPAGLRWQGSLSDQLMVREGTN